MKHTPVSRSMAHCERSLHTREGHQSVAAPILQTQRPPALHLGVKPPTELATLETGRAPCMPQKDLRKSQGCGPEHAR